MELEQSLEQIFFRCTGIQGDKTGGWKDMEFFGGEMNLQPLDLVLFLTEAERKLKVSFDKDAVAAGGFDTFNHALKLLSNNLK